MANGCWWLSVVAPVAVTVAVSQTGSGGRRPAQTNPLVPSSPLVSGIRLCRTGKRDVRLPHGRGVASVDSVPSFESACRLNPQKAQVSAMAGWAPKRCRAWLPTNYHKLHPVRQFHGCYSVGIDTLWGVVREKNRREHPGHAEIHPLTDMLKPQPCLKGLARCRRGIGRPLV